MTGKHRSGRHRPDHLGLRAWAPRSWSQPAPRWWPRRTPRAPRAPHRSGRLLTGAVASAVLLVVTSDFGTVANDGQPTDSQLAAPGSAPLPAPLSSPRTPGSPNPTIVFVAAPPAPPAGEPPVHLMPLPAPAGARAAATVTVAPAAADEPLPTPQTTAQAVSDRSWGSADTTVVATTATTVHTTGHTDTGHTETDTTRTTPPTPTGTTEDDHGRRTHPRSCSAAG